MTIRGGDARHRDNIYELPAHLPVPVDDGACDHLPGMALPPLLLPATDGAQVCLASLRERSVVYAFPRTGEPDSDPPPGWNQIPGARGCTPESCGFRDHHAELTALDTRVYGLSTQTTEYQQEVAERLRLPFALLSDADLFFTRALRLPTFEIQGWTLIKRLTLVVRDGVIEHVFYPIFPPDRHAQEVLAWLKAL